MCCHKGESLFASVNDDITVERQRETICIKCILHRNGSQICIDELPFTFDYKSRRRAEKSREERKRAFNRRIKVSIFTSKRIWKNLPQAITHLIIE